MLQIVSCFSICFSSCYVYNVSSIAGVLFHIQSDQLVKIRKTKYMCQSFFRFVVWWFCHSSKPFSLLVSALLENYIPYSIY